jgi:hypothetical protein
MRSREDESSPNPNPHSWAHQALTGRPSFRCLPRMSDKEIVSIVIQPVSPWNRPFPLRSELRRQ